MWDKTEVPTGTPGERIASTSLLDALRNRRSRRFARGLQLAGPLAYTSTQSPDPLSIEEEAVLAFAANGVTGYPTADLPYRAATDAAGGGGNIMIHLVARTVPSGDASHCVALIVINDGGAWLLRRPQDYPPAQLPDLIAAGRRGEFVQLYEASRIRLCDSRVDLPRQPPFTPTFNWWSTNRPGTTLFLPVHELSALYINVMLAAFSEEHAYFVLDDRSMQPAGLGRFARSKGGYLNDDPKIGCLATVAYFERWICEFASWEEGAMLQNLALAAAALGLGGFPHFAAHSFGWFQALDFRMESISAARSLGVGPIMRGLGRVLGKDFNLPSAVGLEREGQVLIKPFCPPYYRDMREAVHAFVDYKMKHPSGTLAGEAGPSAWADAAAVRAAIPPYSERTIEATAAYCDYVYRTYGRFPACSGPFRTLDAYQAHRLDEGFYRKYYREGPG